MRRQTSQDVALGSSSAIPDSANLNRSRTFVGTGIGNALEWFDWSIYSVFAPFFAVSFFFPDDPVSAFLAALVIFAVGFIARPVGGYIFGRVSDKLGRKRSLALTVGAAGVASLTVAMSPTYAAIGVAASIVLVVARIVQGLAYGGEQPVAQTYLSEAAPPQRRGLWSALIYFSGTIGGSLGILLAAILTAILSREDMLAWGWRVPFVIGALAGLFALFMRLRMSETEQFIEHIETPNEKLSEPTPGLWRDIWVHRRAVVQVIGLTVGLTVVYYFWGVAAPTYSIAVLAATPTHVLVAGLLASLTFLLWVVVWGALSDRIGRKPVLYVGVLGSMIVIYPMALLIDGNAVHLFVAMAVGQFFIAAAAAIVPAVMAELFPTRIRTVGVAVPYAVAVAVFGGTTPYLQAWLSRNFGVTSFTGYVILLLVGSALAVRSLPETRGRVLTDSSADFLPQRQLTA